MIVFKLAVKNVFSRKSSLAIIAFVSLSIGSFFFINSIFDSTDRGIQKNYVSSLTGNIVVRPEHQFFLSLFGDETPVTGSISSIPLIEDFSSVKKIVDSDPRISSSVVQLTGKAVAEEGRIRCPVTLFGVDIQQYSQFMSSLVLLEGTFSSEGKNCVYLNKVIAEKFRVKTGDVMQFIVADGLSSSIRKGTVACIFEYPSESSLWDSLVLCDWTLVRNLMKYDSFESVAQSESSGQEDLTENFDIDSLFEEDSDQLVSISMNDLNFDSSFFLDSGISDSESWNFILCNVKDPKQVSSVICSLNRQFRDSGLKVQAVDWRNGAGSNALYVNILRMILNGGIVVILLVGFIIVNNTLVISVLDRLKEIGTLRAIGAGRSFVCLEFLSETMVLSLISGAVGIVLGLFLSTVVSASHIPLYNAFLVQLFGSHLEAIFTFSNFAWCLFVALFIGVVAWIYPVGTALKISPVEAMSE